MRVLYKTGAALLLMLPALGHAANGQNLG